MLTTSVARAYFLPLEGVEGAGEGGKSLPEISIFEKAFERMEAEGFSGPDIVVGFLSARAARSQQGYSKSGNTSRKTVFAVCKRR